MDILLYITDRPERVLAGKALALCMANDEERQQFLETLAETLEANVMQMKNGDHIVLRREK